VLGDGAVADHELFGDARVGAALGHERQNLAFARRQPVERVTVPAEQQLGHDFRIQRGTAVAW
jgi:hypothetical protein